MTWTQNILRGMLARAGQALDDATNEDVENAVTSALALFHELKPNHQILVLAFTRLLVARVDAEKKDHG